MMGSVQAKEATSRLRKIEGQVRGIVDMIGKDRYCIDILAQTRAIVSAIRKVEDLIMQQHLETCVLESLKSGNKKDRDTKIAEIMDLLSRFRKGV